MNIKGTAIVKRYAGRTCITGFTIFADVLAIDGLCQDAGTGGFSHPSGTAEQEGMRQLLVPDGVFKGGGDMLLPHNRGKILGPVFPRGNDKVVHGRKIGIS
jgi:hypothetical protein